MLELSSSQRSELRALGHGLDPVVMIGDAGLTEAVLKEINRSLDAHGLIKVRVLGDDREQRIAWYEEICNTLAAAPVQHIGKLLVIYRPQKDNTPEAAPARKKSTRRVKILKPGSGAIRNRLKTLQVKANERVTQGGLIKKKKARQSSQKKQG